MSTGNANRWNKRGEYVIYTGWQRSLSTLELVVHRKSIAPSQYYKVMVIFLPDDASTTQINLGDLPTNWRTMSAYSILQDIGSSWYNAQKSLILKVPSAVIPWEYNYIINTRHPDYNTSVILVRTEDYFWDDRLF